MSLQRRPEWHPLTSLEFGVARLGHAIALVAVVLAFNLLYLALSEPESPLHVGYGVPEALMWVATVCEISLMVAWGLALTRGTPFGFEELFRVLRGTPRVAWLSVLVGIRMMLWGMAILLPVVLMTHALYPGSETLPAFAPWSGTVVLIAYYVVLSRYWFSAHLVADGSIAVQDAIKRNHEMARGHRWRIMALTCPTAVLQVVQVWVFVHGPLSGWRWVWEIPVSISMSCLIVATAHAYVTLHVPSPTESLEVAS